MNSVSPAVFEKAVGSGFEHQAHQPWIFVVGKNENAEAYEMYCQVTQNVFAERARQRRVENDGVGA